MTFAALVLWLIAAPPIPSDVMRCIEKNTMFVAQPEFFESLWLEQGDGGRERAYQILDHHQGLTGHLLVMPARCRIIVLIKPDELSWPEGTKPTMAELRSLLTWAGFRELSATSVKPAERAFVRERNRVWIANGATLLSVNLATGEHRRMVASVSANDDKCTPQLTRVGLSMPCDVERPLWDWQGLRAWMRWPVTPNDYGRLMLGDDY